MTTRAITGRTAILALLAAVSVYAAFGQDNARGEEVKDIGLVERTAARLAQIDVTVSGPADRIEDLGRENFELRVGGEFIESFLVDRVCRSLVAKERPKAGAGSPAEEREPEAAVHEVRPSPVTYVFYFDQPHLTMSGRINALEIARDLVRNLVTEDAQAMIISAAGDLEVISDMTSDPESLLAALDELESHKKQWDAYSELEDSRIEEVLISMRDDIDVAINVAKRHQKEEIWQAERSLQRISMVMGRLVDLDPPKAFLYFADTMRSNPGEHYLSFFGNALLGEKQAGGGSSVSTMQTRSLMAGISFDRILNEASAMGIRFYTVQAEGLVTPDVIARRPGSASGGTTPTGLQSADAANLVRVRHAQDTLASMALESGGRSFLNGIPTKKIVNRMRADLSCVYLLSFDPGELAQDEPLPVRVTVTRPKVKVQSRGRLVIQSEEARQTSVLLAAFATSRSDVEDQPIQGTVVPTQYRDGKYSALVQVTVPGTRVTNATWDVGTSLLARGKVREDGAGRIRTATPGVRVVYENEMTFPPGPFELVTVVHETTTDQVFSRKIEGTLPDPDDAPVTLGPITILQPEQGAFLREGNLKTAGALARGDSNPVVTDRHTAMIGLVCRGRFNKNTLRVERTLVGADSAPFPILELEPTDDRCAQFRDLVSAGTMTEGQFRYEVRVLEKDSEIAAGAAEFTAVEPES